MAKHIFYALFLELLFNRTLTRDPVSEQLENFRKTHVSTSMNIYRFLYVESWATLV